MWFSLFKYMDGEGKFLHVEIAKNAMFDNSDEVLSEEVKEQIGEKILIVDFFEYATEDEALNAKQTILEEEGIG